MSCWGRGAALCPATFRGGRCSARRLRMSTLPKATKYSIAVSGISKFPKVHVCERKVVFNSLNLGWMTRNARPRSVDKSITIIG